MLLPIVEVVFAGEFFFKIDWKSKSLLVKALGLTYGTKLSSLIGLRYLGFANVES